MARMSPHLMLLQLILPFLLLHLHSSAALPLPLPLLPPPLLQDEPVGQNCGGDDWQWFPEGGVCLKIFQNKVNFSDATNLCQMSNATLFNVDKFQDEQLVWLAQNFDLKNGQALWVEHSRSEGCWELIINNSSSASSESMRNETICSTAKMPFICQKVPKGREETTTTTNKPTTQTTTNGGGEGTTTTEEGNSTTEEGTTSSTTIKASTTSPARIVTTTPTAGGGGGCADEYEIQVYLEVQA